MTYHAASAQSILKVYADGEASPEACVGGAIRHARKENGRLNAFLHLASNPPLSANQTGLLNNIPLAVKDNILVEGLPATAGSKMLEGFLPPYSASVVERVRKAGGVIIGKTNLDEFGMGSSNEHSAFGPVRNPWNPDRVPGGSSGGSAAAVAAGCVPAALGSDTGGSIRQPAAFCGIYGLKPSYGRVSRYGLVAFASSLDQVGAMARDLDTLARVYTVIAGADPKDATTLDLPLGDPVSASAEGLVDRKSLRVGIAQHLLSDCEGDVSSGIKSAVSRMGRAGMSLSEIRWPDPKLAISAYYVLATAEASSNLARYDGVRYGLRHRAESLAEMYRKTRSEGFGWEVKRRILMGTFVLSKGYYDAYYGGALATRKSIKAQFDRLFERADVLLLPTTPTTAFSLGERLKDPMDMYMADVFTVGPSLAGLPALNVPIGLSSEGLPVGMQLVAPKGREDLLFRTAATLEELLEYRVRIAPERSA